MTVWPIFIDNLSLVQSDLDNQRYRISFETGLTYPVYFLFNHPSLPITLLLEKERF